MPDASASPVFLSAHARYAAHAAAACGYAFRSLDGGDGYLFEVSDGARRAVFAAGAGSPYALNDANAASIARDKAFCAETLKGAGLPVVPGRVFFVTKRWAEMRSPGREPEDALAFAASASYPIFCKPISASNGLYAEMIDSAGAFADYVGRVSREHFAILVQPYVRGREYRALVLNGRVLFSYRKYLPEVVGDGACSLGELAGRDAAKGRDERGAPIGAEAVPLLGERILVEGPANRAAGGRAEEMREGAPEALTRLAVEAADAIGLKLAGVDVFDVSHHGDLSELLVIEVNSNPMIATLEDHNCWDLIDEVWRANFAAALR